MASGGESHVSHDTRPSLRPLCQIARKRFLSVSVYGFGEGAKGGRGGGESCFRTHAVSAAKEIGNLVALQEFQSGPVELVFESHRCR